VIAGAVRARSRSCAGPRIHAGLEEDQTPTTAFLGAVQAQIGIALKVGQIAAVGRESSQRQCWSRC
jgi:hypothetical protein